VNFLRRCHCVIATTGVDRDRYVSDSRLPQCLHLSAVSLTCSEHCGQVLCDALLLIIAPAPVKTIPATPSMPTPSTSICGMAHEPITRNTPKTAMNRPRILATVRILHLMTTPPLIVKMTVARRRRLMGRDCNQRFSSLLENGMVGSFWKKMD
jgi:hypothetical protein